MIPRKLIFLVLAVSMALIPFKAMALLKAMPDRELAGVCGREGISLAIKDFKISGTHSIIYKDTSSTAGTLKFGNFAIDDGAGGYIDFGTAGSPITLDVGAVGSTTWVDIVLPSDTAAGTIESIGIGNLVFRGEAFGEDLVLTDINLSGTHYYISPHDDGLDLEAALEVDIGELYFKYNTAVGSGYYRVYGSAAGRSGIHLTGAAGGTLTDPTTWTYSGPLSLGSRAEPLQIDVQGGANPYLMVKYDPSSAVRIGDVRIEKIEFDPMHTYTGQAYQITDFGCCAIEDLDVSFLNYEIPLQ